MNELITQLEAANPTPSPAEAVDMLGGSWKLVYTSNSELIALLALSRLPFVTIGDIIQNIDTGTMTVENKARRRAGHPPGRHICYLASLSFLYFLLIAAVGLAFLSATGSA